MVWSFLALNVLVVLVTSRLRYGYVALRHGWPVPVGEAAWWCVVGAAGLVCVTAALDGRRCLRRRAGRRALGELVLVFPVFFAFEWGMLPAKQRRPADWAVMAALAVAMLLFMWRDRRNAATWGLNLRRLVPAVRLLAVPTAVMIAVPVAAGAAFGYAEFESHRLVGALLYPFWALAQLLVFQVFLVQRLRRMTRSRGSVVAVAAGMFSLLHWPNGIVMAACLAGAVVWTLVYLRRPNVYALALSMGLAAAAFANALPRERLLQNLRTGPICVHRRVESEQWSRDAR